MMTTAMFFMKKY